MATELETQTERDRKSQVRKHAASKRESRTEFGIDENLSPKLLLPEEAQSAESSSSLETESIADNAPAADTQAGTEQEADDQLDLLRELILGSYEAHVTELEAEIVYTKQEMDDVLDKLDHLSERIDDKEALLRTISPVIANSIRSSIRDSRPEMIEAISPIMADSIRTNIRDSKEQMVEALYPIMGQLVQRSVREAMKDLVRRIDHQIQSRISYQGFVNQIRARFSGISPGELALRSALPFSATDVFLIHRHSGLLLLYVNRDVAEISPEWADNAFIETEPVFEVDEATNNEVLEGQIVLDHPLYDTDLISGMLTAIRDFVQDAFGHDENEHLNQVVYGEKQILIETAQNAYMAVVIEGTEPYYFRANMRDHLIDIEHEYSALLVDYDGNAAPFELKKENLQSLLHSTEDWNDVPPLGHATTPLEIIDSAHSDVTTAPDKETSPSNNHQSANSSTAFNQKPNSTSPSPLSILLIINLLILLLWWLFQ